MKKRYLFVLLALGWLFSPAYAGDGLTDEDNSELKQNFINLEIEYLENRDHLLSDGVIDRSNTDGRSVDFVYENIGRNEVSDTDFNPVDSDLRPARQPSTTLEEPTPTSSEVYIQPALTTEIAPELGSAVSGATGEVVVISAPTASTTDVTSTTGTTATGTTGTTPTGTTGTTPTGTTGTTATGTTGTTATGTTGTTATGTTGTTATGTTGTTATGTTGTTPTGTTGTTSTTSTTERPTNVNPVFADHFVDTQPSTAVIIELKKDIGDDERFFYLYSPITNQAGYRINTGNGIAMYNGYGSITYIPNASFYGTDTFFYSYDGWEYGYGRHNQWMSFNSYGYDWQSYYYGSNSNHGWAYDTPRPSNYGSSLRKKTVKARVNKYHGSPIGPTSCQVYAVNDFNETDSQFVRFEIIDLARNRTVSRRLGPVYKGFDIESLAINPVTMMLYAPSHHLLYLVHPTEGTLKVVGEMSHNKITGLAFHPKEATLWGWTNTSESGKQRGIIQIDPDTGASKMVLPVNDYSIEDLAWSADGNILYATATVRRPNQYGTTVRVSDLIGWYYDGNRLLGEGQAVEKTTTRGVRSAIDEQASADTYHQTDIQPDNKLDLMRLGLNVIGSIDLRRNTMLNVEMGVGGDYPVTFCEGFGDEINGRVESLETRADGFIMFAVHEGTGNKIFALDPRTCSIDKDKSFGTPYSDIEGIAWPLHCQSNAVPVPRGWDVKFVGNQFGNSLCLDEAQAVEIRGKVDFASKGYLNLKSSWQVITPEGALCPKLSAETGLADPNQLEPCPVGPSFDAQMVTGSSEFTLTTWWPGLKDKTGRYYDSVEILLTAQLFDMMDNKLDNTVNNTNGGRDLIQHSIYATAADCKPPEALEVEQLSAPQLLSLFFVDNYGVQADIAPTSVSVSIDGVNYVGVLNDVILQAVLGGVSSSSFQDVNDNGTEDLVIVYADGSRLVLQAQMATVETIPEEIPEKISEEITDDSTENEQVIQESEPLDFAEYVAKFEAYLQQILSDSDYQLQDDGLLSLVLGGLIHSGQLSTMPIGVTEPHDEQILFGELTTDDSGMAYFPVTFGDGQIFALHYLGNVPVEETAVEEEAVEEEAVEEEVIEEEAFEEEAFEEEAFEEEAFEEEAFEEEAVEEEAFEEEAVEEEAFEEEAFEETAEEEAVVDVADEEADETTESDS